MRDLKPEELGHVYGAGGCGYGGGDGKGGSSRHNRNTSHKRNTSRRNTSRGHKGTSRRHCSS